jgi:cobalt/nickel transport system ATP-binding protein
MLFEISDVSFRYHDATAIDRLTLSIEAGTRVVLLGANGSGKSTLLRLLAGLCFPHSGEIRFDGQALSEASLGDAAFAHPFRRRVGVVFQDPDVQLFNPTVFDEVAFGPLQLGGPRAEIRDRVEEALERFRLLHLRSRAPHRLSGGEKKRVALASVLVMDPEVLLLDEPTAALDPKSQSELIDLLMDWAGRRSVLTATHDLGFVEHIAERCAVLDAGRLVADRPPADVLQDVELLTRTNLVHAHRHGHGAARAHVHAHVHRHGHQHGKEQRDV